MNNNNNNMEVIDTLELSNINGGSWTRLLPLIPEIYDAGKSFCEGWKEASRDIAAGKF
ncbi:MAG: hypothetical protein E6469_15040 [Clostridium perfringens]|nr:hypothetical protein [Clostridium butyricum]MDU6692100.1 hypothetical protein [Clostridium perfringens]